LIPTLSCDALTFQPCSDRALSFPKIVGDAFREPSPHQQTNQSPYFGSFLEDELFGGHEECGDKFSTPPTVDALQVGMFCQAAHRRRRVAADGVRKSGGGLGLRRWAGPRAAGKLGYEKSPKKEISHSEGSELSRSMA